MGRAERATASRSARRRLGECSRLVGSGDHLYPVRQFSASGGMLPGLEAVLAAFDVRAPWVRLAVLLGPAPSLGGGSALAALREGDAEGGASVARTFGDHAA